MRSVQHGSRSFRSREEGRSLGAERCSSPRWYCGAVRRAWPALAILGLVSVTGLGRAETTPLPLVLTWDAPRGCPEAPFVLSRIEQLLRGPKAAPTVVLARAKIAGAGEGAHRLTLTLRTADVEETRTIDAASCSALAEASAVVIALAIDPSMEGALGTEPPPPVAPPPPVEPPSFEPAPVEATPVPLPKVAPTKAESPSPTTSAGRAPTSRVALGVGGSVVSGALPSVGAGLVGSAALRLNRFRVGVVGTLWSRQSPTFDGAAGASFDMAAVGASGAYMLPVGRFAIGPSANLEATFMGVQGFGIRAPRASLSVWPTAVLGGRLEAGIAPSVGLFACGDLVIPIGAPTITLATTRNAVRLHEPSLVAPRLSVGIEIVFP